MKITSYPTHYEVTPYVAGYNRDLEVNLSVWNKPYYRWEPLGYRIIGQTLYLPKGIDSEILSQTFRTQVFPGELYKERYVKKKYHMLLPPRDNLQKVAIDFIIGQGEYAYTRRQNQVAINLRPGDGKTYCTIHGIIESGRRALIITHASKIRSQWYDEFLKTTDVPESELMIVDGVSDMEKIITGDADADFFFINHQTLQLLTSLIRYRLESKSMMKPIMNLLLLSNLICCLIFQKPIISPLRSEERIAGRIRSLVSYLHLYSSSAIRCMRLLYKDLSLMMVMTLK